MSRQILLFLRPVCDFGHIAVYQVQPDSIFQRLMDIGMVMNGGVGRYSLFLQVGVVFFQVYGTQTTQRNTPLPKIRANTIFNYIFIIAVSGGGNLTFHPGKPLQHIVCEKRAGRAWFTIDIRILLSGLQEHLLSAPLVALDGQMRCDPLGGSLSCFIVQIQNDIPVPFLQL